MAHLKTDATLQLSLAKCQRREDVVALGCGIISWMGLIPVNKVFSQIKADTMLVHASCCRHNLQLTCCLKVKINHAPWRVREGAKAALAARLHLWSQCRDNGTGSRRV